MWFLFHSFLFLFLYVFSFLPFIHFALPIYEWSDFRCCSVVVVTVPGKCFERQCIQWSALSARNTWTPKKRRTTIKCAELLFEYLYRVLYTAFVFVFVFEYLFVSWLALFLICIWNLLTIALKYSRKIVLRNMKWLFIDWIQIIN